MTHLSRHSPRAGQSKAPWIILIVLAVAITGAAAFLAIRTWRVRWLMKAPREKASIRFHMREYDEAIRYYELALEQEPNDPELFLGLARCHLARRRLPEAGKWAERAVEAGGSEKAILLVAEVDMTVAGGHDLFRKLALGVKIDIDDEQRSRLNAVLAFSRRALERNAKSIGAHSLVAEVSALLGKHDDALRHGARAVELAPERKDLRLRLAHLAKIAGKIAEALDHCRYAIHRLNADDSGLFLYASRLAAALGRHGESVSLLTRFLERQPGNLTVRVELARAYLATENYKQALAEASKVTRHYERGDMANLAAHRVRGYALVKLGRYDEAVLDLRRVALAASEDGFAQHWLGVAQLRSGDRTLARTSFLKAAQLDPRSLDTHDEIARMLADEGQFDLAIQQYRRGIAALPDVPEARQRLIRFCLEHGLDHEALTALRELFRLRPTERGPARQLAQFHLERGETDLAFELANYALQLDRADVDSAHLVARVLAAQGRYEEAAARFAETARHTRLSLSAYLQWATMHQKLGQNAAVEDVFWRAERALPDSPELRCARAQFHLASGKVAEGLAALQDELKTDPTRLAASVALVDYYLSIPGGAGQALDVAQRGREATRGNTAALALVARALRRKRDWVALDEVLEDIVARDPRNFLTHQRLPVAIQRKQYTRAVAIATEALKQFPRQRQRLELDLAIALLFADRGTDAIAMARGPSDRDRMDGDAGYVLSLIEMADGGKVHESPACRQTALAPVMHQGWADLKRLHDSQPADAIRIGRLLLEAYTYDDAGWHRMAAETVEEIFAIAPDAVIPQVLVPVLWHRAGETQKALQLCTQYANQEGASPYVGLVLADLLLLENDTAAALKQYERAARQLALLDDPRMKLALLSAALGHKAKALDLWKQLFRDRPQSTAVSNNLAWSIADWRDRELTGGEATQARAAIGAAVATAPDDPAVADTAGWLHYRLGEDNKAVEMLSKAARLAPYRAIVYFHLGMAHARLGNPRDATRALTTAIRLAPDEPFVDEARRALAAMRY